MKKTKKLIVGLISALLVFASLLSTPAADDSFVTFQFGNDNIISQAATISCPDDFNDVTEMLAMYHVPNGMVFNIDAEGNVAGMGKTIGELFETIEGKTLPILVMDDEASKEFVKTYIKENKKTDVMLCSKDASLVKSARLSNKKTMGVIDFTDVTKVESDTLANMVATANENYAKTVIISDAIATRENVEYIQKRVISVWVYETTDVSAKLHAAIQSGANGIITDTPSELNEAYNFYEDDENLLVRRTFVVGHRGLPSKAPENTMESAKASVAAGIDIIELDVRLTSDKELVIYHENDLKTLTDGSGDTKKHTLTEIKSLTVKQSVNYGPFSEYTNCKIPTLKEFFDEFKDNENVFFFVEIKADSKELTELTCEMIKEYGYESRVAILSFYQTIINVVRKNLPGVSMGLFTAEVSGSSHSESVSDFMTKYGINNLTYHAANVKNKNVISALMYHGITTWPWTYNASNTIEAYFSGAAGITTDTGDLCSDIPVDIDVGKELYQYVAPGSKIKFKPTVLTRVGTYEDVKPELVLVDGEGVVKIDGNKVKAISEGTAYLMYRLSANVGSNADTKMTIYSELIEIKVDAAAPKKSGCSGNALSGMTLLMVAGACLLMKKKNEG